MTVKVKLNKKGEKFIKDIFVKYFSIISPEDLPDPGIEPRSPTLQADALPSEPFGRKF